MGELIVNGIKWAFIIGIGLTFMTAILTLINFIVSMASLGVIGEVLGIINACMPFDFGSVFAGIGLASSAILSFMVSAKIYHLVGAHVEI